MRWLARLFAVIRSWLFGSATPPPAADDLIRDVRVDDEPDVIEPRSLYVVGESGYIWHFTMLCPCGCDARIQLNALDDAWPRWKLIDKPGRGPSLLPSVWRTTGCKSHFFVRDGRIAWCLADDE